MISIIVPVYNVEEYLPRCIESILQQTYKEFELLLIDDGSKDNSGKICDKYSERDHRIRVIHKSNGGLSDARNSGLDQITGDFVTFIDSDDYIGPAYLNTLFNMIQKYNADVAVCSMIAVMSKDFYLIESEDKQVCLNKADAFKETIIGKRFGVSSCAKLFRRSVFLNIRFPSKTYYEDLYLVPYVIEKSNKCAFSESVLYYYFQRENSIMHTLSQEKVNMWVTGMEKLHEYTKQYYPEMIDAVICRYNNHGFDAIVNNLLDEQDYVARARSFRNKHSSWHFAALKCKYLSMSEKGHAALFLISVRLYRFMFQKLKSIKKSEE